MSKLSSTNNSANDSIYSVQTLRPIIEHPSGTHAFRITNHVSVAPSSPLLRASSVYKHRRSGRIPHVNAPQIKRKANHPLSFTPYIFVVKPLDSDPFGSTCWYHLHCNSGLSTPIAAPKDISDFSAIDLRQFSSTATPAFQLLTSQISEQVLRTRSTTSSMPRTFPSTYAR